MGSQTLHPILSKDSLKQDDDDDDWTRVSRKHKGATTEAPTEGRKVLPHKAGGRHRLSYFDRVMKEKAFSFFFTNFLDSWDSGALWKMFSRYGNVVDVYIAFKRTKKGTRFGFVRFVNIRDVATFERRIKTILIGNVPLVINKDKFVKIGGNGIFDSDFPHMNAGSLPKTHSSRPTFNFSFKDVVVGRNKAAQDNRVKISIEEDGNIRSKLDCCWVGKAKNLQVLLNAWDIMTNNGLDDCKIKYVGGLFFLFEWISKDSALKSLEENKCWLQHWFNDIKPWEETGELYGKLTWVVIEGPPILGRNLVAVKAIAGRFGSLLEVGRLNFVSNILTPVKSLIITHNMRDIGQPIDVILNKKSYLVRIFEEPFVSSCLLSEHKYKWENKSMKGLMFEEEVVGPSMEVQDEGDSLSGDESPGLWVHEKAPLIRPPDSSLMMSKTENIQVDNVGIQADDSINSLSPNAKGKNHFDLYLDELLYNFQRISNNSNIDPSAIGGRKRKHKKKNLVVGEFGPDSFNSQSNSIGLEDVEATEFIGGKIGYSFKPTKLDAIDDSTMRSLWPRSFVDYAFSCSTGASGVFSLDSKICDRNFMVVLGSWAGMSSKIRLINVYAPQASPLKEQLWLAIEAIINSSDVVWILFGDFNVVRHHGERVGSSFDSGDANIFNDFVSRAGLFDFPLNGRRFTRFDKGGKKARKLDRFLVSHNFFDAWDDASVSVLCSSSSNDIILPPNLVLKNKIKRLRQDIKTWTMSKIAAQNKSREELSHHLLHWDARVEAGLITDRDIDKREDWMMDLNHLVQLHTAGLRKWISIKRQKTKPK
ncbi:nucleotide-binding alpha-beta plait domain-containing protein [Tanacetum coccineum]